MAAVGSYRAVFDIDPRRRPYLPLGAARSVLRSSHPEILSAGPADTGKSRGWLEKLHYCADKYPHSRIIMVRKTRKSLTQSAVVTYEKKVLPEGLLASSKRGAKPGQVYFDSGADEYVYPNGSVIALSGMDNPTKVMSSEWDIIYVMEATELSEEDWEFLSTRKRNGVMPYQQLGGDCNPTYPTHWLKKRCDKGLTRMFLAQFTDNPSITRERIDTLHRLTGVRKKRLFGGVWAAAEGVVYEEWDPARHIITRKELSTRGLLYTDGSINRQIFRHFIGGVDWGYTNPGVLQVWGVDNDGREILMAEVYRTQRTDDWWVEQAKALDEEFQVEQWIADPSEPGSIQKFNQAGLNTVGADNEISFGIKAVKARLDVAGDGRPRLFIYEYASRDRDELRDAAYQPVSFENEINEYAWPLPKDGQPIKEVPVKINDHAMDTARYVTVYLAGGALPTENDRQIAEDLWNYRGF